MIKYPVHKAITDYLNYKGDEVISFTNWVIRYGQAYNFDDKSVYFENEDIFLVYRLKYSSPRYA